MESLGENTLRAFMKSNLSKEFNNGDGNVSEIKTKDSKSLRSKDESDIDKYFKDSLVFLSKDANLEKENCLASNDRFGSVTEYRKASEDGSIALKDNTSILRKYVGTTLGEKSSRQISQMESTEKRNKTISSSTGVDRSCDKCDDPVNSSTKDSVLKGDRTKEKSYDGTIENCSIEIPSRISTQDRCKLASWGLPLTILRKYEARGVTRMFPWQVECLSNHELLENNRNLVYSAPTSAGKTLVAEILVIKTVMERRKKVIFILPFVSVVREKMYYFQDLLIDSGLRVEGFMGGCSPAGGFAATDVAIATIEKANSLLNQLMEEGTLVDLGAVVIDELHLLGDPYRGYLLELLLTKLKYMNLREELIKVQLIGMSATLPNLAVLAKWLDAELYKTDFRPVPLNELCKIGTTVYDKEMKKLRDLPIISSLPADSDNIIQLCIETLSDGHSVLIFCPTKNWCEKLACQIATTFSKLGRENTPIGCTLREQLSMDAIVETLEQLKRSPAGLDDVLKRTVSFGAAFHHAGLTMDERDVIEGAFRSGALRILAATSTLSSGVNLPARRVIIRSLMFHGKPLDTLTYRQMIGRAGRMGKDTAGESILVCKTNETSAATNLLVSDLPPIESCLEGSEPLIRALLEAVASEVAYTARDIELYTKCTLVSFTSEDLIEESTREAMKFLIENELCMLQTTDNGDERWIATQLGKACLAASIPPMDGLFLFEELQKARRCFVLDTELHVIYLVTPINSSTQIGQIDWFVFLDIWKSITESERRVGQLVGVDENFLMTAIRGSSKSGKILDIHKRFYTALALHELVREIPLIEVCRKYGCCRGLIQSLQQSAATFAGMVTQFCKKLGWNCMELLIGQFQARLQFGVCPELLDLLRLPMLNGLRARSLYNDGITSVAELAVANVLNVERALHKALPFESGKERNGEHEADVAKRNKMRSVFVTGKDGLTPQEAATLLVREAKNFVQNELGVDDLQWKQRERLTGTNDSSNTANGTMDKTELATSVDPQRGNESKNSHDYAKNSNRNKTGIEKTHERIEKSVSEQIDFPSERLPNRVTDSDIRATGFTTTNTESLNIEKSICTKENPASATNEKILENLSESSNLRKSKMHKKDDAASRTKSESKSLRINESERKEENEIEEDIFELTSIGISIDPKDFTKSKTGNRAENNFELSATENEIDSDVEVICFKTRNKITKKKNSETTNTGNVCDLEKTAIASQIDKSILENICGNEKTNTGSDESPKNDSRPKRQDAIIFKFTGTENKTIDQQEKLIGSVNSNAIMSPLNLPRDSLTKNPDSQSPSLFGDSLNLDSQECNILEQNVIGSLNISNFSDANLSGSVDSKKNTPENQSSDSRRSHSRSSTLSRRKFSLQNSLRRSPRISDSNNKNKSFVWDDDSWNNTNGVIEAVNMLNKARISKVTDKSDTGDPKTPPNNIISENAEKTDSLRRKTYDYEDRLLPKSRMMELQKIPLKRKLSESNVSPIGNLLKKSEARKLSVDSNKSDSDDVILPSQKIRPSTILKNRTRTKLESLRKFRTQGTTGTKEQTKNYSKDFLCENCSMGSIVLSSDEDIPTKRGDALPKTKIHIPIEKDEVTKKREITSIKKIVSEKKVKKTTTICPEEIKVVNVATNWARFNQFKRDLIDKKDAALALACETYLTGAVSIGTKIIGISRVDGRKSTKKVENCVYGNKKICGVAISLDGITVHYISFDNTHESKVPVKDRLNLLTDILESQDLTVRCFSFKETYKILYNCCKITSSCKFLDPKTADWLLNPDNSERSFKNLISEYLIEAQFMLERAGTLLGGTGPGLNVKSTISSEIRATTEAALTWHLTNTLLMKLETRSSTLLNTFRLTEMETLKLLARMELSGLGINLKSLQQLSEVIQQEMSELENKAYGLAGKRFNFSSSKSVAQVLGLYKGKKVSTNKAVLEHCENPLSRLIISWRKLSTTQIKVVFPLLRLAECSSRIYGNCITNTATGRVSMHKPNLQSVPKDFYSQDNSFIISVRMAFVPMHGNVIVSADYCQLELRILAHFSKETNLCRILRKEGDVFKSIAARWYNTSEDKIDDNMRQRTKQLCYGMIYGMGVKTLGESLGVTETEAKEFLETFMESYPGIRRWLSDVVDTARNDGYVTTLMGRPRFLPALNSEVSSERSQAERQAVNTKVQGSAADIAKRAMVKIDERMRREFPYAPLVLTDVPKKRKLRSDSREELSRGGYLILQIHDELLYEVNSMDLQKVGRIIKESMEKSCELRVPLPVKLKVGPTWGDLTETKFEVS